MLASKMPQIKMDGEYKNLYVGHEKGSFNLTNDWSVYKGSGSISGRTVKNVKKSLVPYERLSWTEEYNGGNLTIDYMLKNKSGHIDMSAVVTNTMSDRMWLEWTQELGGFKVNSVFSPTSKNIYTAKDKPCTVGYKFESHGSHSACIPMFSALNKSDDVGISIIGHVERPIPPFGVDIDINKNKIVLKRRAIGVEKNNSVEIRNYYVIHEGCRNPGLAFLREKFEDFFYLPKREMAKDHGCFTYMKVADEKLMDYMVDEGIKYLELHYVWEHLGKYVPDQETWTNALDEKWSWLKHADEPGVPDEEASSEAVTEFMRGKVARDNSVDMMKKYIKDLKARGIGTYHYFQPTESWEFYANTYYPDSVLRRDDGHQMVTWFDHVQMDCTPKTRWAKYLERQLEMLMELYPDLDGIFMDQSAEEWKEESYSVADITAHFGEKLRKMGKYCYWNGPYQVELTEYAIGFLAEGGSLQAEKIKYLTMGNKLCCGMGTSEIQYQRNLINGLWPSTPSNQLMHGGYMLKDEPMELREMKELHVELHRRYMPIYQRLFKGKRWSLESHCLTVPEGFEGNLFEIGIDYNEGYAVPLIRAGTSFKDGLYKENTTVKIMASKVPGVAGAYLLTPELGGVYELDYTKNGNEIIVDIGWFGSAGVIWLPNEKQKTDVFNEEIKTGHRTIKPEGKVMSSFIAFEGVVRQGWKGGHLIKTGAKVKPIPERKVKFNGISGKMWTRNYKSWHTLYTISLPPESYDNLQDINELVIEPDGTDDFFKLRNLSLTIVLGSGEVICGMSPKDQIYSSCEHPDAEGIIGNPVRIPIEII